MTAHERVVAALRNPAFRLRTMKGLWDEVGHDVSPEVVETVVNDLVASGEVVLVERTMILVGMTDRVQAAFPEMEAQTTTWWGTQPTDPGPARGEAPDDTGPVGL